LRASGNNLSFAVRSVEVAVLSTHQQQPTARLFSVYVCGFKTWGRSTVSHCEGIHVTRTVPLPELNTKLDDQKRHFEQAEPEEQAWPVERAFLTHLQKDTGWRVGVGMVVTVKEMELSHFSRGKRVRQKQ
jgi:hypothetical protein